MQEKYMKKERTPILQASALFSFREGLHLAEKAGRDVPV